jgi:putative transposase
MRLIDKQYTDTPFYGVRRMTVWLETQGEKVNVKRVRRLMRKMGIETIYPKPNLSRPQDNVRKCPYLLNGCNLLPERIGEGTSSEHTQDFQHRSR